MKNILLPLALLGVFAGTGPVSAEPLTRSAVVSTAGLDLATAAGQRALDRRVLHAASDLCGTPSPADPRGRKTYEACRTDLRGSAATAVAEARARAAVRLADAR